MRKTLWAGILILAATATLAQAPGRGPATAPAQTKTVPDADATVIAPLLAKQADIQGQIRQIVAEANAKLAPLRIQLSGPDGKSGVEHDLSMAEQDAFSHAKIDSRFAQIEKDSTGKIVFVQRQGAPGR